MDEQFFNQIKTIAEEAVKKGYNNIAISLYSLCGAIAAHDDAEFCKMCSNFSGNKLNEMKSKLN